MKILVTGGAGYIGSHTCKALAATGLIPVTYDNLSTGHRDFVKWGPLEYGDIRDGHRLRQVIATHGISAVIHFAAVAYVGESTVDPGKYYDVNVAGTLQLLRAMVSEGVQKLVFSSSCATYGGPEGGSISENCPQNPINPYGRSKLFCESMIEDFVSSHGLSTVNLRYFNAAGADKGLEIGERHNPETHLIPLVIAAARGLLDQLTIFGDDYPTHDGTCVRDYVHVADLADAHVKALSRCGNVPLESFNLGGGTGTSVRAVVAAVSQLIGHEVPAVVAARRKGDPAVLVAAIDKAVRDLNWQPRQSHIETIVADAWRWALQDAPSA